MTKSGKITEPLFWETQNVGFGTVSICCSEKGVRHVTFGSLRTGYLDGRDSKKTEAEPLAADKARWRAESLARQAIAQIREYAAGCRSRFTVPLDLQGTRFQLKVWKALLTIPYGETCSYREIARKVGNPLAARAVGSANHSNPVAILVPCHRVISSDGSLGGYAGGLKQKSRLLELESRSKAPQASRPRYGCSR